MWVVTRQGGDNMSVVTWRDGMATGLSPFHHCWALQWWVLPLVVVKVVVLVLVELVAWWWWPSVDMGRWCGGGSDGHL